MAHATSEIEYVRSRMTEAERALFAKFGIEIDPVEDEPERMSAEQEAEVLERAKQGGSYSDHRITMKVRIWEDEEGF